MNPGNTETIAMVLRRRLYPGVLTLLLALTAFTAGADDSPREVREALADFVATPGSSIDWEVRASGRAGENSRYAELIFTSQTWRDTRWRHQLYLIRPDNIAGNPTQGLFLIDGGHWHPSLDQPRNGGEGLPENAELFITIAEHLRAPLVVLRQVPFQPMFGGLTEDRLIAHTFERFMETGETDWPLLLPMVKSVVRGMDVVQAYADNVWGLDVSGFTVTGASKRGWTTWLAGAVDERVEAVAPMVIDMLNTTEHLRHAEQSWGHHSDQIAPYTQLGLHEQVETPRGQSLFSMIDPYSYREHLTQPKLIILGTNDEYWPVDSLNLYWDGLPGEKHVIYVPNTGHGLDDHERVVAGVAALHQSVAGGVPLPRLDWEYIDQESGLGLSVSSAPAFDDVRLWIAESETRDMRQAQWRPVSPEQDGHPAHHVVQPVPGRYQAVFAEAKYSQGRTMPLFLSTTLRVLEPAREETSGQLR